MSTHHTTKQRNNSTTVQLGETVSLFGLPYSTGVRGYLQWCAFSSNWSYLEGFPVASQMEFHPIPPHQSSLSKLLAHLPATS